MQGHHARLNEERDVLYRGYNNRGVLIERNTRDYVYGHNNRDANVCMAIGCIMHEYADRRSATYVLGRSMRDGKHAHESLAV